MRPFTDPAAVARYAQDAARNVPGLAGLHRMATLLLAERVPECAEILVLGAGGGLELSAFAHARPHWTFLGVDPSAEMLEKASETLGPMRSRILLQQGYIDDVADRQFDGATCLLTLHFLARKERLRTLRAIHSRLRPGAPLVTAHHSLPAGDGDLKRWLTLSCAFGAEDADPHQPARSAAAMAEGLPVLPVEEDEAILREAGFSQVALFYAGFTLRGWSALA